MYTVHRTPCTYYKMGMHAKFSRLFTERKISRMTIDAFVNGCLFLHNTMHTAHIEHWAPHKIENETAARISGVVFLNHNCIAFMFISMLMMSVWLPEYYTHFQHSYRWWKVFIFIMSMYSRTSSMNWIGKETSLFTIWNYRSRIEVKHETVSLGKLI